MQNIKIAGREIGRDQKPYIIAEISANHNGNIDKALRLIEIAKESGADAVKIQTYTPDTMTINSTKEDFKIKGGLWDGYDLYTLYSEAYTPWEWHQSLIEKAKEVGIVLFSTPFDETAVDFLEKLDVPAYKIASFEATDLPLIDYIASKHKPVILSTGMANEQEIKEAVEVIKKHHDQLVVLHCVSGYPAPASDYNLLTIDDINKKFDVISGLSDHSLGIATAVASVALGACVIEKHFIEDRNDKGPDSEFSIEPHELKELVESSRLAWESIGKVCYDRKEAEKKNLRFRRSIYVVKDVKEGEVFNSENIRRIRPGFGLEPKFYHEVLGQKAIMDIEAGTALKSEHFQS